MAKRSALGWVLVAQPWAFAVAVAEVAEVAAEVVAEVAAEAVAEIEVVVGNTENAAIAATVVVADDGFASVTADSDLDSPREEPASTSVRERTRTDKLQGCRQQQRHSSSNHGALLQPW